MINLSYSIASLNLKKKLCATYDENLKNKRGKKKEMALKNWHSMWTPIMDKMQLVGLPIVYSGIRTIYIIIKVCRFVDSHTSSWGTIMYSQHDFHVRIVANRS